MTYNIKKGKKNIEKETRFALISVNLCQIKISYHSFKILFCSWSAKIPRLILLNQPGLNKLRWLLRYLEKDINSTAG